MRTAALILLAGCDGVFGILRFPDASLGGGGDGRRDGLTADAPGMSPCTGKMFDSGAAIPGFGGGNSPTITDDQLTIFFDAGTVPPTIWRASRMSVADSFSIDGQILASPASQLDPALTSDANTLVFVSDNAGTSYVWQATRSTGGAWGNAAKVTGLATTAVIGVDVSTDGNTIYFVDTTQSLFAWDRAQNVVTKRASNILGGPSVSADGLELFWTGMGGVWYARRGPTDELFPAGGLLFGGEAEPDLSPDGTLLITNMKLHQRICN